MRKDLCIVFKIIIINLESNLEKTYSKPRSDEAKWYHQDDYIFSLCVSTPRITEWKE